jgi:hypothetical protein
MSRETITQRGPGNPDRSRPVVSRIPIVFRNAVVEALGYESRPLQAGWIVTTRK